jgi:exopolysaccharide biosynthesis operon protein EpsL
MRIQASHFERPSAMLRPLAALCIAMAAPALFAQGLADGQTTQNAQGGDTFRINASYSLQTDSNLFRLPAGADTLALIGRSSAAEQISIASLGLRVNKAYSLQRVELDLSVSDYRYRHFSYLDFTSFNFGAAWRWSLTPRLRGNLVTGRKQSPNSFLDYQGYTLRNESTDSHFRFDGSYEIDGAWRLLAGAENSRQVNLLPVIAEGDTSAAAADIGLRYVFASGSTLSYGLKNASGKFLNRALQPATLLDDSYRQTDNALRLHWLINGMGTADVTAAYVVRTHPNTVQRDYSGLNTGVNLNWTVTGKSALAASWIRELASYQSDNANYSQTDRVSLGPVWQISPKAAIRLRYEVAIRNFLGSPTSAVASQRSDTTREATLSFDWQPYQRLNLGASLQSAKRTSNLAGLDFSSNLATFFAQYNY